MSQSRSRTVRSKPGSDIPCRIAPSHFLAQEVPACQDKQWYGQAQSGYKQETGASCTSETRTRDALGMRVAGHVQYFRLNGVSEFTLIASERYVVLSIYVRL